MDMDRDRQSAAALLLAPARLSVDPTFAREPEALAAGLWPETTRNERFPVAVRE